ncbi:transporter substrate-binding domain-containing protein, partial [Pseudomonas lurida]
PHAHFRLYDNYQDALSAVAFGQAQAFLGNSYSLSRNFLNNVQLERFSELPVREVGFALNKNDGMLVDLINQAMAALPQEDVDQLQRLWQPDLIGIS